MTEHQYILKIARSLGGNTAQLLERAASAARAEAHFSRGEN